MEGIDWLIVWSTTRFLNAYENNTITQSNSRGVDRWLRPPARHQS